jgi:hypothetical protein
LQCRFHHIQPFIELFIRDDERKYRRRAQRARFWLNGNPCYICATLELGPSVCQAAFEVR